MKNEWTFVMACCLAILVVGCGDTDIDGNVDGTVKDIDGNVYGTVKIGNQVWMTENLRATRYSNGDEIPYARSDRAWENEDVGMRCAFEHDDGHAEKYGQLYNWFAVADDRGLCPTGWRVPSDEDWNTMERSLGLSSVDAKQMGGRGIHGAALKSELWDGTNSSGFSGLPGGLRNTSGNFGWVGGNGYWWSASPFGNGAWGRYLNSANGNVARNFNLRRLGFSVRCVRD